MKDGTLKNNILSILLFKIEDRFEISGRGLILTPGPGDKVKFVRSGTSIRLIRPDKSELKTSIIGIGFEGDHDILVPPEVSKEEIPIGTEVWTIE